jgi:hypothetical protein
MICPTLVDETDDTWGHCTECQCQNTGLRTMFPLDGCEDVLCIPCGHYAYWERMKEEAA